MKLSEKIQELKELDLKLRILICVITTIISILSTFFLLNHIDKKVEDFDSSKIYSLNGIISNIRWEGAYTAEELPQHPYYLDIELENNKKITFGISEDINDYYIGEEIIVYTDGKNYSTTEAGVAMDATNSWIEFAVATFILLVNTIVLIIFFGWKGFIISICTFIIFLLD